MLLVGILGLLFLIPYASNRRFGVLGLALTAGSLLSTNWTGTVTPFIEQQGVVMVAPPLAIVVSAALVLLPPLLLLLSGPSYAVQWQRILGSLAFAFLAFAFLVDAFEAGLQLDSFGAGVTDFVDTYASLIIVMGICAALTDIVLTGRKNYKGKKDK